ncbi:hypothetical protein OPV22_005668 [Ensete ventricosum]|uniref:Uncharacterized protein n=1 Tax=Ensete ventricosum TaxID=4639 RepID=A0AAV8RJM6_ENSVE|nr:hypothetical protein OPV22_005668 [Ensete ventricosum]
MSDDPPLSHRRPSRPSNSYHSFQRQEHIAVSSVTQEQFLGPLNEGQKRLFITKLEGSRPVFSDGVRTASSSARCSSYSSTRPPAGLLVVVDAGEEKNVPLEVSTNTLSRPLPSNLLTPDRFGF